MPGCVTRRRGATLVGVGVSCVGVPCGGCLPSRVNEALVAYYEIELLVDPLRKYLGDVAYQLLNPNVTKNYGSYDV